MTVYFGAWKVRKFGCLCSKANTFSQQLKSCKIQLFRCSRIQREPYCGSQTRLSSFMWNMQLTHGQLGKWPGWLSCIMATKPPSMSTHSICKNHMRPTAKPHVNVSVKEQHVTLKLWKSDRSKKDLLPSKSLQICLGMIGTGKKGQLHTLWTRFKGKHI